jgi:hypothetical protein
MAKNRRKNRGTAAATNGYAPKRPYFITDPKAEEAGELQADAEPDEAETKLGDLGQDKRRKGGDVNKDDLIKRFQEEYEAGWNKDRDNQDEAYRDLRLIGDDKTEHWDQDALTERTDEGRPALIVNQCPQFVRQVTGDMRQLKPAIKVVPVNDAASKEVASKILPGMIRYIEQRSKAQSIYFGAADQQAGCGIGHWRVNHEYASTNTFAQEICIEPIPDGVAVVWDPDAVLPDRSDALYCFVPVDMAKRKFDRLYPGKSSDPLSPSTPTCFTSWFSDEHVRVAEWFYIDPEKKRLALYQDGKIDDVTGDEEAEAFAQAAGARIQVRDGHCVYRVLVSATEIIEGPDKWPGPDIPIVPLIGEEVQIGRATVRRGVVRCLRDVQRIYNYGISTKTEILALQPKSPWVGTNEQFEEYQDDWESANRRNLPYLRYKHVPGVPPPQRSSPTVNTQHLDGLLIEMQGAMNSTTGIYPAALGAKSNETSGVAIRARQNEGDTGTFVYLSNFQCSVQRTGQIIVNMIPQIYDTKRTIQIAGDDGKIDSMPINQPGMNEEGSGPGIGLNDVTVGAYHVAVEMGASFSTKREESREGMTEMLRTLGPQGASLFLDLFIKAQDWPLADKIAERAKELLPPNIRAKEAMEAGEQPPPPPPPPPPTPEQQAAMELEQKKAAEQQQANIELARKNEIAEAQLQFDKSKMQFDQRMMPAIAELQAKIRAAEAENDELKRRLAIADVQHEVEKGTMEFENLELKHAANAAPEEHEAALLEKVQENINKAREHQLQEESHELERRKLDMEHKKLAHGAHADEEAARAAAAEEVQKNIELARANELKDREHQLSFKKLDYDTVQLDRTTEQQKREHELAMNPPPEPPAVPEPAATAPKVETAAGQAGGEGQNAEIDDLKGHVASMTHSLIDLSELVASLVQHIEALESQPPPAPPAPPPAPPDYMPHLIDVIGKFAQQRKPLGVKRTKDGMQVVYDDEPPEAPPA